MKKKLFLLLFPLLAIFPIKVKADNRVIDGNEFDVYKRSKEDITNKWNVGQIDKGITIFESMPSYVAPYKAGVTTDEYLREVTDNLNYYRYLVGVPEVKVYPKNDVSLQTAEVVQTLYVNKTRKLTHELYNDFPKPNDMSDNFYNIGANANHNIISYGKPGEPNFYFFDESAFDESYPESGHRMALLSPDVFKEEYGIGALTIYGRSTSSIDNYNNMNNNFAAYPSPGYFPKQDFADISDWDIFLNTKYFKSLTNEELNNVTVTFKNLKTGIIETRSVSDNNLVLESSCSSNTGRCLYLRFNILQPSKDTTYYEDNYEVYVKNLIDNNNELVDLKYNVKFYDKLETIETYIEYAFYELYLDTIVFDGDYDENLINNALEGIGLNLDLDIDLDYVYKPDRFIITKVDNNHYKACPDTINLPNNIKDNSDILSNTCLTIIRTNNSFEYGDTSYQFESNTNGTVSVNGFNAPFDGTAIYYWVFEKDGKFYEFDDENKYITDGLNLNINDLNTNDSGNYYLTTLLLSDEYMSIYFLSKPLNVTVTSKYQKGDMNRNDKIDLQDIIILLKKYLKTLETTTEDLTIGDMDENGSIGIKDIILLLRAYLGTN